MRGKGLCFPALCKLLGITPAYAGKSQHGNEKRVSLRDHPRVCGEKRKGCSITATRLGSPPRMRGKAPKRTLSHRQGGITPAYAGKSILLPVRVCAQWDHPRVCGEKKLADFEDELGTGSPPRMRGKVLASPMLAPLIGITPAYAGKSFVLSIMFVPLMGSPPRMRGKGAG